MFSKGKKGIALFIVLGTLLIVIILANIILNFMLSQSRLTHHQVSRIQAQYAAQAGINYALEKLRLADDPTCWPATGSYARRICRNPCSDSCSLTDSSFPLGIDAVVISVGPPDVNGTREINATVDYTYAP